MSGAEGKIVLLLAASDLTANEIRSFFKSLDRAGPSELVRRIEQMRSLATGEQVVRSEGKSNSGSSRFQEYDTVLNTIENLLIGDAGLSKAQATNLLYSEVTRTHGNDYYIPSPNKVAFKLWMVRLLDQIPPSDIMHIASKIRNDIVHGRKSASEWPLYTRPRDD